MTFRHIIDCHGAFLITGGKVRGRDRDHNRAHPGVNVAEDVRDPDPVEDDRARFTTGVQAQVKALSFVQRKDVVEERVEVREIYFRSEEHTSELQSLRHLVCRLLLEKKKI